MKKNHTYIISLLFPFTLLVLIGIYFMATPFYKYEISIVMPVYNTESYLPQNLKSILNQSFTNFELIIVNDASTDNSLNIIKKYAKQDKRIKVISLPQNSGAAAARNEGIKHIRGKYSLFIDSDDYLTPDMLQKLYNHATQNNLDIVLSDAQMFDEEKQQLTHIDYWLPFLNTDFLKAKKLKVFSYKNIPHSFFQICSKYTWNKLIKSSIIQRHQLKFQIVPKHNDTLFITKALLLADRIGWLDEKLYVYRINRQASITSQTTSHTELLYTIFAQIKEYLIERDIYTFLQKSFNKWIISWIPQYEVPDEEKPALEKLIDLMDS